MLPSTDWPRAADPARRIGYGVEVHATIGSTNDRAREVLRASGTDGLAIVAEHQDAGRGRRGRTWVSPPGVNLMVSVAIWPRLEPARAGLLGLAAALAVRDACAELVPDARLGVRWPNDVVTPEGLKVAGLLLETTLAEDRLADAVIGTGINVNWPRAEMPDEIAGRATSLAELAGEPVDRVALLAALLNRLDAEIAALEDGASPVARLREASVLDGRAVVVEVGEETVEGVAAGVGDDGALLLDTPAGRLGLSVGEVVVVRDVPVEAGA
jgi:BirA family biotin operon repressor/biotin-[acetyl-CoA-carboxylase] ligase